MNIKIENDGKQKWQSWSLEIRDYYDVWSNEDKEFTKEITDMKYGLCNLIKELDITICASTFEELYTQSLMTLEKLLERKIITKDVIDKVMAELNRCKNYAIVQQL